MEQFEAIKDDVDSTVAGRTATGLTMPRERYEAAVAGQLEVAAVAAKALAEFGCDAIAYVKTVFFSHLCTKTNILPR